ncbi:MAG: RNA polymerase sigma factor [Candidatus Krumholzibacteria bacterium]|nr:RNA polymerase sigma factor [Candidatus Krumholzibacteria bacterium]
MNDDELVRLAREGNRTAFGEIYDRHAPGVARALASFAGEDRDALDDLVQEVFFKVIEGLPSYTPRRPFPHWLYTIALNTGRNHVRDNARELPVDPSDLESAHARDTCLTDLPEEILGARLVRLVAALPGHLREVVSLRIGSGLPYGEIGEILGVPEGTARSRMHSAVVDLRASLGVVVSEQDKESQ